MTGIFLMTLTLAFLERALRLSDEQNDIAFEMFSWFLIGIIFCVITGATSFLQGNDLESCLMKGGKSIQIKYDVFVCELPEPIKAEKE